MSRGFPKKVQKIFMESLDNGRYKMYIIYATV